MFDTLLPFSSENEDKASSKPVGLERSPLLKFSLMEPSSYLKLTDQTSRIAPDFEDSHACGFVHRSLDLQSFACLYMGIRYPRSY
ncbi:hypothetical protein Tco_0641636 [Tanacetum coccineum]